MTDWIDDLEFPIGPPWLRMGVSRTAVKDWLIPDEGDGQLEQRRVLVAEHRPEVIECLDAAVPAVEELAALVATHVGLGDDAFAWDPLGQVGGAVCEDFCILLEDRGVFTLAAAVVCFPSHWRLAEKMGGSMAEIHAPVPGYEADLGPRVDTFLSRIGVGQVFERRNWSIHESESLFTPWSRSEGPPVPVDSEPVIRMRSERQTFRRLPESNAVVFTIRTQQAPLEVIWEHPVQGRALEGWMQAAPPDLVAARCGSG